MKFDDIIKLGDRHGHGNLTSITMSEKDYVELRTELNEVDEMWKKPRANNDKLYLNGTEIKKGLPEDEDRIFLECPLCSGIIEYGFFEVVE